MYVVARNLRTGEMVDGSPANVFHVLQVGSRPGFRKESEMRAIAEANDVELEFHHSISDSICMKCVWSVFAKVEPGFKDAFSVQYSHSFEIDSF